MRLSARAGAGVLCRLEAFLSNQQERFMTTDTLSRASTRSVALSPLPDVLARIRAGQPVLVLDDADRENEADLIVAADRIDARTMAMLIREGSGIVCLCIR